MGAVMVIMIIMMEIYPNLIQPLFNTFTELEEGPLKTEIDKMAESLNFPVKKVFLIDGSKRSSHSNAYQYGFGNNKRIVIYDTLIKQCPQKEVMSILWHELGHWYHGHIYQLLGQELF